jgi:hypothetical protein
MRHSCMDPSINGRDKPPHFPWLSVINLLVNVARLIIEATQ